MGTDELYKACIVTFRKLGVGNEEEAQELTERYIRENTYLSDKRGQEEQILEIWHRRVLYSFFLSLSAFFHLSLKQTSQNTQQNHLQTHRSKQREMQPRRSGC